MRTLAPMERGIWHLRNVDESGGDRESSAETIFHLAQRPCR